MRADSADKSHTLHDQSGVEELRAETLSVVSIGIPVLACGILIQAAINPVTMTPALWLVLFPLLATSGAAQMRRFGVAATAVLLLLGLALSVLAATIIYPGSQLVFTFPLLVIVASMLLGELPAFAVAAAITCGVVVLERSMGVSLPVGEASTLIFLVWATAILSWMASRPTRTALEWAWKSYSLSQQRTEELRDRQGELGRVAKSLGEACARLEQMNWELERARRAAEEARRLKAEFAAAISHELRTPLNLVIGFSEMMLGAPAAYAGASLPDGYRQDLEAIYRNACHISRLIDDVLDLSQIEAHRMALERSEASLRQIADEAAGTVGPLYEHLGLSLTVNMPEDLPCLYVDANRIRQILINLLNNAARFTDHGGVTIGARSDGHDVVVTVADTGIGMAPEDLPYVFQEFRQVGPVGRRRGGSGLGLAVCKQFAEMHGGCMWVESEPGKGSTFYLTLPRSGNVVSTPVGFAPSPRPAGDRTVAVLDRESETARVFQRYLDGYHVVWAECLGDLRQMTASQPLHAIILAGNEAIRDWQDAVVNDPQLRNLPVFTCALNTRRALAEELGVTQYLVKPISRASLASTLHRLGKTVREVLVVEDDLEMSRLLAGMIQLISRRYRVRQASDGTEALGLLHERRPDLVVLDLLLPLKDGYEILREMKADSRLHDVPIVVISAKGAREEIMRTSTLGINRADGLTVGEVMRCLRGSLDALLGLAPQGSVREQLLGPAA